MRSCVPGLCVGALLLAPCLAAWADEENVALDKLPRAVTEAVKTKFPRAKLVSASKEIENKKTVYEVKIKNGEQTVEVTTSTEGEIVSTETLIAVNRLPRAVRAALDGKYPAAAIKKAEEIRKGKKLDELSYEVLLLTKDKKTLEVRLDPRGKVLETETKKGNSEE